MSAGKNKITAILTLIVLSLLIPVPIVFSESILDLNKCISTALENNPDLRKLRYDREISNVQLKSTIYSLYPQLSLDMGYSNQIGHSYATDADNESSGYNASLRVSQSLFTSGKNTANLKKARNSLSLTESRYIQQENSLVVNVKKLYYQVLANTNLVKTRENELKRRRDNLVIVKLLYQVGNEKKSNLDQSEYYIKQAAYNLNNAIENLDLSILQLKKEIGLAKNEEITIAEQYTDDIVLNPEQAIEEALRDRQDLKQMELNIETNKLERISLRSEYLPAASVSAGYNWGGERFFPDSTDWNAMFSVSLPISSGFPLYSKLKENEINNTSLILQKKDLIETIGIEVRTARIKANAARNRLSLSEDNIKVAKERAVLAGFDYNQGNISFIEFEEIENNLSSAELELIEARNAYELAKSDLLNTIGTGYKKEAK